ncbi:hypothetical protein C8R42DRAFT_637304 [Lentinula raphanica]|nr:hypothetical protein C8R42DRAFT_637304 [Lentinula raphanica]
MNLCRLLFFVTLAVHVSGTNSISPPPAVHLPQEAAVDGNKDHPPAPPPPPASSFNNAQSESEFSESGSSGDRPGSEHGTSSTTPKHLLTGPAASGGRRYSADDTPESPSVSGDDGSVISLETANAVRFSTLKTPDAITINSQKTPDAIAKHMSITPTRAQIIEVKPNHRNSAATFHQSPAMEAAQISPSPDQHLSAAPQTTNRGRCVEFYQKHKKAILTIAAVALVCVLVIVVPAAVVATHHSSHAGDHDGASNDGNYGLDCTRCNRMQRRGLKSEIDSEVESCCVQRCDCREADGKGTLEPDGLVKVEPLATSKAPTKLSKRVV